MMINIMQGSLTFTIDLDLIGGWRLVMCSAQKFLTKNLIAAYWGVRRHIDVRGLSNLLLC